MSLPNLPPARHRARPQLTQVAELPTASPADPPSEVAATYTVGYGKPPKHTQFKPGQSGNPKGRPKHSRNVDTIVRELLDERITINTPSGPRRLPRIEVLVRKLVEMSAKGNMRAMDQLLRQYAQAQAAQAATGDPSGPDAVDLSPTDEMSLALLREMLIADAGCPAVAVQRGAP